MAPQGWGPGCQSKSPLCPSRSHCCRTSNRNFVQALTLHCIIFSNQVVFVHLVGRSVRLPLLYSELSKVLAAQWLSLLPPVSHSFEWKLDSSEGWKLCASGGWKREATTHCAKVSPCSSQNCLCLFLSLIFQQVAEVARHVSATFEDFHKMIRSQWIRCPPTQTLSIDFSFFCTKAK